MSETRPRPDDAFLAHWRESVAIHLANERWYRQRRRDELVAHQTPREESAPALNSDTSREARQALLRAAAILLTPEEYEALLTGARERATALLTEWGDEEP